MTADVGLSPNMTDTTLMLKAVYTRYPENPLRLADRCDSGSVVEGKKIRSCGAQAWSSVGFEDGAVLLFCRHHLNTYIDRLMETAKTIDDFTPALDTQERAMSGSLSGGI